MARKPSTRPLLLSILALHEDLSHKEIEARAGLSPRGLSQILRRTQIKEGMFERLLAAIGSRPAVVRIVTACVEALEGLEAAPDLSPQDREAIEDAVLAAARVAREDLTASLRHARTLPMDGYPKPADLAPARIRAGQQWERLKDLPEEMALAVVRVAEELQSWALCEKVCEESVRETSRSLQRAAALARLAVETAEKVQGPEGWCKRVRGYAGAHGPNVLRVAGELQLADAGLEEAKRLWLAGTDPGGVLDPGRLLSLEASLRRDQRRFEEALKLLDEAAAVGRTPEQLMITKAFTLEAMGEEQKAVDTLLQAEPLVESRGDLRLRYMLRYNLAINYCHMRRYREAAELAREVRELVSQRGDTHEVTRIIGLEGRIEVGLGRPDEGLKLLGEARRRFAAASMSYDVALLLLEEASLLLEQGQAIQVKKLADDLARIFGAKGVHREALAALRLFYQAVQGETATPELARSVLRYLLRARYDQRLRFVPS